MIFGRRAFLLFATLALIAGCASPPIAPSSSSTTTIYLVRHAEKQAGDNPGLTPDGYRRASALADRLVDSGLLAVYATDTRRARETAAPVAEATGLAISLYDPRALDTFATALRDTPGAVLVVGHSNTTPQLVALLGGDPGTPIDEATEFDRIYVLEIFEDGMFTHQDTYGAD